MSNDTAVPPASFLRPLVEYGVALTPLARLLRPLLAPGAADPALSAAIMDEKSAKKRSNFPPPLGSKVASLPHALGMGLHYRMR